MCLGDILSSHHSKHEQSFVIDNRYIIFPSVPGEKFHHSAPNYSRGLWLCLSAPSTKCVHSWVIYACIHDPLVVWAGKITTTFKLWIKPGVLFSVDPLLEWMHKSRSVYDCNIDRSVLCLGEDISPFAANIRNWVLDRVHMIFAMNAKVYRTFVVYFTIHLRNSVANANCPLLNILSVYSLEQCAHAIFCLISYVPWSRAIEFRV